MRVRDGIDLDVRVTGQAGSSLVVLVPGAGAPLDFWPAGLCQRLSGAGFAVVRYSHRDSGYSTHVDQAYSVGELLTDLMALIARLRAKTVDLVGHSMGAYVSEMAMCRYPGVVRSVTSISAGPAVGPEAHARLGISEVAAETWTTLMENRPVGDFGRDLPGWLRSWRFLNGRRPFDEAEAVRYTRALYKGDPRNAQVAEHHVHAMSTVPLELVSELEASTHPLLVIHGTDDPLVPIDHGEALARLVSGSRLVRLEGAGHMFFHATIWEEIADAVLEHVRSVKSGQEGEGRRRSSRDD